MIWVESILFVLLFSLGGISSYSDIRHGLVYNRILLWFLIPGAILDVVYYVFFAPTLFLLFVLNNVIISVVSLVLFFTKSFAGGDSKLLIVISLLYPARFYFSYGDSRLTLLFALCFALFFGYVYLLAFSISGLLRKRQKVPKGYVKSYLSSFGKSYITIFPYIILLNLCAKLFSDYLFTVNTFILMGICFVLAWTVNRIHILKKWYFVVPVIAADIGLSIWQKTIPFSVRPMSYLFTLVIILFQMTIKTGLYETIPTVSVKKGMILSTASSLLMQNSRVKNLPPISSENLGDRLTEEEAASVRRWATSSKGTETVAVMKKVPFAVFIILGYLCYLIIWGLLI